jgi:DNA repair ATPase RecN
LKVKIRDFQIIKEADLEFSPGITAIVGSSNNGKSSIIRAIEAAINNKGGSSFINYDSDSCEVTIEDNGHTIIWHKDQSSRKSFYDIDGEKLTKIGQTQLDEVGALLNMSEISVNNDRFRLNFWKQMDFPFLVGRTSYQLFDFISKSKEQEMIQELREISVEDFKTLKKDTDNLDSNINLKTKDISVIESSLEELRPFTEYNLVRLEKLVEIKDHLSTYLKDFDRTTENISNYTFGLSEIVEKISMLTGKFKSIESLYEFSEALMPVIEAYDESVFNLDSLENTDLKILDSKIKENENKVMKLEALVSKIEDQERVRADLQDLLKEYCVVGTTLDTHKDYINNIEEEIVKVNKSLEEFEVCPLCGNSLKEDSCGQ